MKSITHDISFVKLNHCISLNIRKIFLALSKKQDIIKKTTEQVDEATDL